MAATFVLPHRSSFDLGELAFPSASRSRGSGWSSTPSSVVQNPTLDLLRALWPASILPPCALNCVPVNLLDPAGAMYSGLG
eukprot:1309997-Rhodomonas_salina.2